MSGEAFAGSSAGAGARGPFPGASYSGKHLHLFPHLSVDWVAGTARTVRLSSWNLASSVHSDVLQWSY